MLNWNVIWNLTFNTRRQINRDFCRNNAIKPQQVATIDVIVCGDLDFIYFIVDVLGQGNSSHTNRVQASCRSLSRSLMHLYSHARSEKPLIWFHVLHFYYQIIVWYTQWGVCRMGKCVWMVRWEKIVFLCSKLRDLGQMCLDIKLTNDGLCPPFLGLEYKMLKVTDLHETSL